MEGTFLRNGNRHICLSGVCGFVCVTERRVGRRRRLEIAKGENHHVAQALRTGAKASSQADFEEMYRKALQLLNR